MVHWSASSCIEILIQYGVHARVARQQDAPRTVCLHGKAQAGGEEGEDPGEIGAEFRKTTPGVGGLSLGSMSACAEWERDR